MADFNVVIEGGEQIVVDKQSLLAFRFYERLSGLEPTLDKSREDLRIYAPEDAAPPSPFNSNAIHHTPPVLGHEPKVQPPYYAQILIDPSVLENKLEIDDLLGRPARLEIAEGTDDDPRHVRGIILRALERRSPYGTENAIELQIYPWVWALSLSEKSRVWANANSITVLDKLIEEYQPEFADSPGVSKPGLSSEPGLRESVIQWQESDFELLSRLLERDGIYYFFKHDETTTTIMLGDSKSPYAEGYLPNRSLTFHPTVGPGGELFDDHINFVTTQVQTVPRSYHVADYNPLLAGTKLDYVVPQATDTALRIYDYPGDVAAVSAGPDAARRRYTAVTARQKITLAASRNPFVSAGHATTISGETSSDDQVLRVTQAVHELVRDETGMPFYRNWFEGIEGTLYYAPTQRTPLPAINGTHNAIVISSLEGETVDLDEDSRVLVTFRWDQDEVPVRVRLGQPTAGTDYGTSVLPREGQEVLISFIQGNTERPIILTSLNNSDNQKSDNPTQMATAGLDGEDEENLTSRQNRYTTSIQNTTGNQILFNDEPTEELFKMRAYKDFILEIGHKSKSADPTTDTTSSNISTVDILTNDNTDLSDYLDDSSGSITGTADFDNVKANRGTALIRTYGDLTLYVGKLGKVFSESNPGGRADDNLLAVVHTEGDDEDIRLSDDNRGDYNIYVMGGTSTVSLGSYAWVLSPISSKIAAAEFKLTRDDDTKVTAKYSNGTSTDVSISDSTSFGTSNSASYTAGFGMGHSSSADISTSIGVSVAQSFSAFNMATTTTGMETASPFSKTETQFEWFSKSNLVNFESTDPAATAIDGLGYAGIAISSAAMNALIVGWSAVILSTAVTKFSNATDDATGRSTMQDFMVHDFDNMAVAIRITQAIIFGINLAFGVYVQVSFALRAVAIKVNGLDAARLTTAVTSTTTQNVTMSSTETMLANINTWLSKTSTSLSETKQDVIDYFA